MCTRYQLLNDGFRVYINVKVIRSITNGLRHMFNVTITRDRASTVCRRTSFFLVRHVSATIGICLRRVILRQRTISHRFSNERTNTSRRSFRPKKYVQRCFASYLNTPITPTRPSGVQCRLFTKYTRLVRKCLTRSLFGVNNKCRRTILRQKSTPSTTFLRRHVKGPTHLNTI